MLVSTYSDNNVSGSLWPTTCVKRETVARTETSYKGLDIIVQVSTRFVNFFFPYSMHTCVLLFFFFFFFFLFPFNWSTNWILTFHPMNWLTQNVQLCGNQPFGYALICQKKKKVVTLLQDFSYEAKHETALFIIAILFDLNQDLNFLDSQFFYILVIIYGWDRDIFRVSLEKGKI